MQVFNDDACRWLHLFLSYGEDDRRIAEWRERADAEGGGAEAEEGDYDEEGFDEEGFDEEGFDEEGYDCDGYDCDGYDRDGYNAQGEYGYEEGEEGYDQEYDEGGEGGTALQRTESQMSAADFQGDM